MALTVGLLVYLGIDATFLGLRAVAQSQTRTGITEGARRLCVAFMISLGIGLHNLGEGLAIGASFSIGAATLGTFLAIGFILQNITEGLGIIAPIVKEKASLRTLAGLGLLGGTPAIIGTWVGGLVYSPILSVLFLSIGAGAVFEVAWEIVKLIRQDREAAHMPLTIAGGAIAGMSLLYVTGLLIK
jgi:zinc transporter ZupT